MLWRGIISDKRPRAPDNFRRCEKRKSPGRIYRSAGRELSGDDLSGFYVTIPTDDNNWKSIRKKQGQLGIERPSLRSPCTPRSENNKVFIMDSHVGKQLVDDSTLIVPRIESRPQLLGHKWICAIAESERQQSF